MTDAIERIFKIKTPAQQSFSPPGRQSPEIFDDFSVKKNVATREGTIEKVPVNNSDITNKKYVDDAITALGLPLSHTNVAEITDVGTNTHAQIDTAIGNLTGDVMADAQHRHSELSASDGTPNPALQVDAAGNVGIGTTEPETKLDVFDTLANTPNIRIGASNTAISRGDMIGQYSFTAVDTSWSPLRFNTGAIKNIAYNDNATAGWGSSGTADLEGAGLGFYVIKDVSARAMSEAVRIDYNGNVGIGTTVPTSKLHVVGLPIYANNAAAVAGGLTAGAFYRTNADPDPVCAVH